MFKKISLTNLISNLEAAIRRFPLPALVSACAATVSIILIHATNEENYFWIKILLVLILSFPLLVSSVIIYETKFTWGKSKYILNVLIVASVVTYYFLLPKDLFEQTVGYKIFIRHILWVLSSILIVTFVGFLIKKENLTNAFWQYNKKLVFSLIFTGIYVVAIGAGLSIALTSTDFLFDLNIDSNRYAEIWAILWSLFAPLFFLARVPKNLLELQNDNDYPKELKLFAKYVLLPLVSIYFLILYSYTIKVIISWEWPKGILAYMISGFSFLGVLAYVVLYPLRDQFGWAKKYGYIFFSVLIPQVGMLFWALWFRVSKYSITENRALVFLFGSWLLGIAIYFLISKRKNIRLIPITLCLIMVLSSFGPWSIFNISRNCQTNRLIGILENYNAFSQGKITKISDQEEVSKENKKEISGIIRYLYDAHGPEYLQKFFSESIKKTEDDKIDQEYLFPIAIVEDLIGVDYIIRLSNSDSDYFSIESNGIALYDISNFDQLIILKGIKLISNDNTYGYNIVGEKAEFDITKNNKVIASYYFDELVDTFMSESENNFVRNVKADRMIIKSENEQVEYELHLKRISGYKFNQPEDGDKYKSFFLEGILLFNEK